MNKDTLFHHKTVLINEVLEYLDPQPGKVYVDCTFGGGGHTRAILRKEPRCSVIAVDWDLDAIKLNAPAFEEEFGDRFQIVMGNFSHLERLLNRIGVDHVDGILADFGTSQYQIKEKAGFSFAEDTPLDMRMSSGHYKITAADIVNHATAEELRHIFTLYGEERFSNKIAQAIVTDRKIKKFKTTRQLAELIERLVGRKPGTMHPATRVFQALRIAVNHELDNIHSLLQQAPRLLKDDGRLVCISFHSLEDRMVKQFINSCPVFENLTNRVVIASSEELAENPSSRSAKLRAAEKIRE